MGLNMKSVKNDTMNKYLNYGMMLSIWGFIFTKDATRTVFLVIFIVLAVITGIYRFREWRRE
jgi:hypothetical protein